MSCWLLVGNVGNVTMKGLFIRLMGQLSENTTQQCLRNALFKFYGHIKDSQRLFLNCSICPESTMLYFGRPLHAKFWFVFENDPKMNPHFDWLI